MCLGARKGDDVGGERGRRGRQSLAYAKYFPARGGSGVENGVILDGLYLVTYTVCFETCT